MSHKTLKQLFPELPSPQRSLLGDRLRDVLDVVVTPKILEDGHLVRLYHENTHDKITLEAAKLFGDGR
jgi:hypothetical protein